MANVGDIVNHKKYGLGEIIWVPLYGISVCVRFHYCTKHVLLKDLTLIEPKFKTGQKCIYTHIDGKPFGITKHCTGEHTEVEIVSRDIFTNRVTLYKVKFPDDSGWWVYENELKPVSKEESTRNKVKKDYDTIKNIVKNFTCNEMSCKNCPFSIKSEKLIMCSMLNIDKSIKQSSEFSEKKQQEMV